MSKQTITNDDIEDCCEDCEYAHTDISWYDLEDPPSTSCPAGDVGDGDFYRDEEDEVRCEQCEECRKNN